MNAHASPNAAAVARAYRRRKLGNIALTVEVNEFTLADFLVAAGYLDPDAHDRAALAAATSEFLIDASIDRKETR